VWWREAQAQGIPVAFDVKSTREKTRWPLQNIEPHQVSFLQTWQALGGLAFVLVEFAVHNRYFILPVDALLGIIQAGAKSIALDVFRAHCPEIRMGARGFYLDYLGAAEQGATMSKGVS